MPSQLSKVQKQINKKKGRTSATSSNKTPSNTLHENSRDAQRLRRASARDDRLRKTTSLRSKANTPFLDRIMFVQSHLPETLHPLPTPAIQDIVSSFLIRHDAELEQLKSERRSGRPPSNRQSLLEQQIRSEAKEFEGGFWMPDLRDEGTLMALDGWDGEWLSLGTMRFVRVVKDGDVKESGFPPRGAS